MDAGIYNVRRATCYTYCQTCNGVTGFSISANPFSVAADGQTQLTFYEIWNTGAQYDSTTLSTWSTSNSGIATVGTPGSGTPGLVSGVSGGSVTIGAKYNYNDDPAYTSYWCEGSPWTCPYTYYTNGPFPSGSGIPLSTISETLNVRVTCGSRCIGYL
jgi:Bacterial Ig-like domain (group 2)